MRRHFEKTEEVDKNSSVTKENGTENKVRNQILEPLDTQDSEKVGKPEKSSENPDGTKKSAREKFDDLINKYSKLTKKAKKSDANSSDDDEIGPRVHEIGHSYQKNENKEKTDSNSKENKDESAIKKLEKQKQDWSDSIRVGNNTFNNSKELQNKSKKSDSIEKRNNQTGYDREL